MVKKVVLFVSGLFFLFLTASYTQAASVDLAWDPPVDGGEVEGYVIFGSTISGEYSDPVVMEIVGDIYPYATISGLDESITYYFIVKAYNYAGIGKASNEVCVEPYSDAFYDDESNESKGSGGCFITTVGYGSF